MDLVFAPISERETPAGIRKIKSVQNNFGRFYYVRPKDSTGTDLFYLVKIKIPKEVINSVDDINAQNCIIWNGVGNIPLQVDIKPEEAEVQKFQENKLILLVVPEYNYLTKLIINLFLKTSIRYGSLVDVSSSFSSGYPINFILGDIEEEIIQDKMHGSIILALDSESNRELLGKEIDYILTYRDELDLGTIMTPPIDKDFPVHLYPGAFYENISFRDVLPETPLYIREILVEQKDRVEDKKWRLTTGLVSVIGNFKVFKLIQEIFPDLELRFIDNTTSIIQDNEINNSLALIIPDKEGEVKTTSALGNWAYAVQQDCIPILPARTARSLRGAIKKRSIFSYSRLIEIPKILEQINSLQVQSHRRIIRDHARGLDNYFSFALRYQFKLVEELLRELDSRGENVAE